MIHPGNGGGGKDEQNEQNDAPEQNRFARINSRAFLSWRAGNCRGTHSGFPDESIPQLARSMQTAFEYQRRKVETFWLRKFVARGNIRLGRSGGGELRRGRVRGGRKHRAYQKYYVDGF